MATPLERLRYHVTGAIERGEATPIIEVPARDGWAVSYNGDDCRSWWDNERRCYIIERRVNGQWVEQWHTPRQDIVEIA